MEKRMIIAFVLSILVFVAWSLLFPTKQETTPPKEDATVSQKRPGLKSEMMEGPFAKPSQPPGKELGRVETTFTKIGERLIEVETPLYKAIFSNLGATLVSFKLKHYYLTQEADSPPIELAILGKGVKDFFKAGFGGDKGVPESDEMVYEASRSSVLVGPESSPQDLTFRFTSSDGVSITQTYRFYPENYHMDLMVRLENGSENRIDGRIGVYIKNLPSQEKRSRYSFLGVSLLLNGKLEQIEPEDLEGGKSHSGRIDWVAYESAYFMTAVAPNDVVKGAFKGQLLPSGIVEAAYITPPIELKSREQISSHFTLYFGPRDLSYLKPVGKKLDKAINFGWFDVIARPLLYTLRFFNKYVNNYGLSIILLTVMIKIIFWPLTHKSYKSMGEMKKLQPLMAKIREKHKNDKARMNKELMGLYKTYKVNPMGGCLPMVIQIPVFFALFRILGGSIELRHAPFLLWIDDLSSPDRLFNFPFEIPFMDPPYGIPILTLLMGASMFIQQKMTPTPGDPAQAKIMMFLPIIFTVMFINFPSGLVLYWLTNNLLSIGQQSRIKKS